MTDPRRSISDDIETTIASLDVLHGVNRARRDNWLDQLRGIVANLDRPGPPDEPEPTIERPERDSERRRSAQAREVDDAELPQRRMSRGGPFGPAVRAKLERIARTGGPW